MIFFFSAWLVRIETETEVDERNASLQLIYEVASIDAKAINWMTSTVNAPKDIPFACFNVRLVNQSESERTEESKKGKVKSMSVEGIGKWTKVEMPDFHKSMHLRCLVSLVATLWHDGIAHSIEFRYSSFSHAWYGCEYKRCVWCAMPQNSLLTYANIFHRSNGADGNPLSMLAFCFCCCSVCAMNMFAFNFSLFYLLCFTYFWLYDFLLSILIVLQSNPLTFALVRFIICLHVLCTHRWRYRLIFELILVEN